MSQENNISVMESTSPIMGGASGAASPPYQGGNGTISYAQSTEMISTVPESRTKRNFHNQFNALFRKSATYQWRQYKTNICQITLPLVLIILLFVLQTIVTNFVKDQDGAKIPEQLHPFTKMPRLFESNETIVADCRKYFMPGVTVPRSITYINDLNSTIVEEMMTNLTKMVLQGHPYVPLIYGQSFVGRYATYCSNSPSLILPLDTVESPSYDDFKQQVYSNWKTKSVLGALDFGTVDNNQMEVSLLYNRSLTFGRDLGTLYNFAARTYFSVTGANLTKIIYDGLRDYPTKEDVIDFDLISLIGPTLYIFIFQLILPVVLRLILYEKENKLREIMKMMGLEMKTYWLVTYIFSYCIYFVAMMLVWLLGALFRFRYFTINNGLPIFLLIFFWGHLLVSFAFFLSTFFGKTNTATVVGYIWVFGTGILGSRVIDNILSASATPSSSVFVISLIPPFVLYRALLVFKKYVSFYGAGVQIATMNDSGYEFGAIYGFMIIEALVFLILALYLEEIMPSQYGVKRHPLFFLKASFWNEKKKKPVEAVRIKERLQGESEDVAAERTRLINHDKLFSLEVCDLGKVYPAHGGAPKKVAVKSLAMGVDQGICFGFLGPNGAGKSTTLSCISGLFPPTTGTCRVYGYDIREDIEKVHMLTGVCPQDNVLWDDLTGEEHLLFYGRIKNMKGKELHDAVYEGLKQVNLHKETGKKSGEYSGGMRRRLSVACSLMGNPLLILMDEPSTGLDPASRKQLWDIINAYKRRSTILLTTHAMEEAQELCDRLGIFVGGELKCIGTSSELKSRFGKGYKVMMQVEQGHEAEALKFIGDLIPTATLLNSLAGNYNYEVPKESVQLSTLFNSFEQNKERLHLTDWGISNSSLEEVFVKITMGRQNEKGQYVDDNNNVIDLTAITNN